MSKILIFGGSNLEVKWYATRSRLKPNEYKGVQDSNDLRGIERGIDIYFVGTWYTHRKADEVESMALDRNMNIITDDKVICGPHG